MQTSIRAISQNITSIAIIIQYASQPACILNPMSLDTTLTSTEPTQVVATESQPTHTLSQNSIFKDTEENVRKYQAQYIEEVLTKLKNREYKEARARADEIQTADKTRQSPVPRTSINHYCSTFVMSLIRTNPLEAQKLIAHFNHPYNWQYWLQES